MLGGILTKTIKNIIRFYLECLFDFRRKYVFAHTVFAQVVHEEEKKASGWIRFDPLSRRLQIADQDKKGDSFFEISIHIQFSNPSHGNIEMYKMKAKNKYF